MEGDGEGGCFGCTYSRTYNFFFRRLVVHSLQCFECGRRFGGKSTHYVIPTDGQGGEEVNLPVSSVHLDEHVLSRENADVRADRENWDCRITPRQTSLITSKFEYFILILSSSSQQVILK